MMQDEQTDRLSRISTRWVLVQDAHRGGEDASVSARRELIRRYGGAVYRYLLGALRDPNAAEDLAQEFALRFVRGDFRRADPARGRFRSFIKTVLFHLIVDYSKGQRRRPLPLIHDGIGTRDDEPSFEEGWRDELLARAWGALAADQAETGRPYYEVLHLRVEHPEWSSTRLAEAMSDRTGRAMTPTGLRQTLHRARQRFAELLLNEVVQSLNELDPDRLEQELIELRLLDYCRHALKHRVGG